MSVKAAMGSENRCFCAMCTSMRERFRGVRYVMMGPVSMLGLMQVVFVVSGIGVKDQNHNEEQRDFAPMLCGDVPFPCVGKASLGHPPCPAQAPAQLR